MILNAQILTQTRFCAAQYCPHDAEPSSELCTLHIRLTNAGVPIVLHAVQQPVKPDPATHLWCPNCPEGGAWHPDAAFNKRHSTKLDTRRGRRSECRKCEIKRRREHRQTPEGAKRAAALQRLYRKRLAETPEVREARLARRRARRMELYHAKKAKA